ncbi:MAG: hypothetical protein IKP64_09410, partial [Selenomonadaceae bacterium]|nr:hypothetical protein [Selenomonadaceae bacterium]
MAKVAQVRTRKRGKTFSYIFEAGKTADGKRMIITPERFKSLLEKYPFGTPFYIPFLLLYHTKMRLGEVSGLSWSDINFAAKK